MSFCNVGGGGRKQPEQRQEFLFFPPFKHYWKNPYGHLQYIHSVSLLLHYNMQNKKTKNRFNSFFISVRLSAFLHRRNSARANPSFVKVFCGHNLLDTTRCKTVNSKKNKALRVLRKVKIGRWKWGLQADLHTRPLHPWLIITTLGESHRLLKGSQSHYGGA